VEGITSAHCKTMQAGTVFLQFHDGGRILLLHISDTATLISNTDIYWVENWLSFIHIVVLCLTFLIFWCNVNFVVEGIIHVVHVTLHDISRDDPCCNISYVLAFITSIGMWHHFNTLSPAPPKYLCPVLLA